MVNQKKRRGQGLPEYAFIIGFISLLVIVFSGGFSTQVNTANDKINTSFSNALGLTPSPSPSPGGNQNPPPPQDPPPGDGDPILF